MGTKINKFLGKTIGLNWGFSSQNLVPKLCTREVVECKHKTNKQVPMSTTDDEKRWFIAEQIEAEYAHGVQSLCLLRLSFTSASLLPPPFRENTQESFQESCHSLPFSNFIPQPVRENAPSSRKYRECTPPNTRAHTHTHTHTHLRAALFSWKRVHL